MLASVFREGFSEKATLVSDAAAGEGVHSDPCWDTDLLVEGRDWHQIDITAQWHWAEQLYNPGSYCRCLHLGIHLPTVPGCPGQGQACISEPSAQHRAWHVTREPHRGQSRAGDRGCYPSRQGSGVEEVQGVWRGLGTHGRQGYLPVRAQPFTVSLEEIYTHPHSQAGAAGEC